MCMLFVERRRRRRRTSRRERIRLSPHLLHRTRGREGERRRQDVEMGIREHARSAGIPYALSPRILCIASRGCIRHQGSQGSKHYYLVNALCGYTTGRESDLFLSFPACLHESFYCIVMARAIILTHGWIE